jgi:hypothetical protein
LSKLIVAPLRFRVLAAGFALGAASHLTALLVPSFADAIGSMSPAWRHALFASIDATLALALMIRPPLLLIGLLLLLGQQLSTHGMRAWQWWAVDRQFDWYSLALVVFIASAVIAVFHDLRTRGARPEHPPSAASPTV